MGVHQPVARGVASVASQPAAFFAALWRAPSVTLARIILEGYVRSGWVWGEVVLVLAQFAALMEFAGNTSYWFDTLALGLGGQAILGTALMVHRAFGARAYLPLTRLAHRAPYPRALVLASSALRVPLFALYLLCILLSGRLTNPTPGGIFSGTVGLLAGSMVLVAATVLLSPHIATRLHRILFLVWLVLALATFGYDGPLAPLVAMTHLPLLPIAASFAFGARGAIGWPGLGALALDALLVGALILLAQALFARRDLLAN